MTTGILNNTTAPKTITVITDSTGILNPGDLITFNTLYPGANIGDNVFFEIHTTGRDPFSN